MFPHHTTYTNYRNTQYGVIEQILKNKKLFNTKRKVVGVKQTF